jgi:hypothetical protein
MRNQNITFTMILFLFGGLAFASTAWGVLPAPVPDGAYLNGNTAEGGATTLHNLTSGHFNTAVGYFSLNRNTTGGRNTATGTNALRYNTTGNYNTATGTNALFSSTGSYNTAVGDSALANNVSWYSAAFGANALSSNTTGQANTAIGTNSLAFNRFGGYNTAVGADALNANDNGQFNIAIGSFALPNNVSGDSNTAIRESALLNNSSGNGNTAVGEAALRFTFGDGNTALGVNAGMNVGGADNVIAIGSPGANVSNTTWIGNIFGVTTQSGTTAPVIVSNTGQLGTVASSERFKKDIATMEKASEAILSFRPVTFHYRTDAANTPQFGLVAEEVAKVNPALVLPDKEGKPYTVRYDAVNAMLLNEFLKAHRNIQEQGTLIAEQQKQIAQQQKQIEALTAGLQKVSAQMGLSKGAPQTVSNNQ